VALQCVRCGNSRLVVFRWAFGGLVWGACSRRMPAPPAHLRHPPLASARSFPTVTVGRLETPRSDRERRAPNKVVTRRFVQNRTLRCFQIDRGTLPKRQQKTEACGEGVTAPPR
jgi:hypothetical protein